MAEKKIIRAEGERKAAQGKIQLEGNPVGLRIGAIICWIIGLAFEVVGIFMIANRFDFISTEDPNFTIWLCGALVLDMIFVIIGSVLWKKANHICPASTKNAFTFWLWNNMGVIVACIAFIPIIIYLLTQKDLDSKTKTIATIVAGVAFAIAGVSSYDFNPVSQEDLQEMYGGADIDVYWVATGSVYHTHQDCNHLNASTQEDMVVGSIGQAEDAGKDRLCKTCERKDEKIKAEAEANGVSFSEQLKKEAGVAAEATETPESTETSEE